MTVEVGWVDEIIVMGGPLARRAGCPARAKSRLPRSREELEAPVSACVESAF